ncbi:hypothetical protein K438DRAFT_2024133 [Mycena galopus ATCC 62051]|nr:hypothetical protein K438DRAFT_2024133 [Mycena galopus ATCC 62051]
MPRPSTASSSEPTHISVVWILREFVIIVALSSVCLFALIQTVQYHARVSFGDASPCATVDSSSCAPFMRVSLHFTAPSPLDVLKITASCTAVVLLAIEVAVRMVLYMGWVPAHCNGAKTDDVEAYVCVPINRKGEERSKPLDVLSLSP